MSALLRKRKSIELSRFEQRLTYGPRYFFFRHENLVRPILKYGLQALGLYERGRRNALTPEIRPVRLSFEALPPAFCGFRILHLSDLHIDGIPGLAERVVDLIQHQAYDICVFTGDYRFDTHGPCHNVYPEMQKLVSAIHSEHPILGILGNHDYAEEIPELEAMGIRMLMNQSVEIREGRDRIWFSGLDDAWDYDCADLPAALAEVPRDAFKVLLAHSPDLIESAAAAGVSVYLCGHTHAGQIRLPGVGALLVPADCERKYLQGLWQKGSMQGFTSAGIGCSLLPVRFWCPPEIGLIELCCFKHATETGRCNQSARERHSQEVCQ